MDKNEVLVKIQKIFESAAKENVVLYEAYKKWNGHSNDEGYDALVKIIHPKGDICVGMPLSYSSELNFWRACEVIKSMIVNDHTIENYDFVEFILRNSNDTKVFLSSYFRESLEERRFNNVKSLFRCISEHPEK